MQEAFYILQETRQRFIELISNFSEQELNQIPRGWNNNLVWNFGHVLVTQQLLCYKLSGLPMLLEEGLINAYRKGTKPEKFITASEIIQLKTFASETSKQIALDYDNQKFKEYQVYTTSFGVQLNHINQAIVFNNTHEALHLGYALSLRKAIT